MKKYELILNDRMKVEYGDNYFTLYRIRALRDFGNVKTGDLGGYVQSEHNLSHEGESWIYDEALVFHEAKILDNTKILDDVQICGKAHISGNTIISNYVKIHNNVRISGNVQIDSYARLYHNAEIDGNVRISGHVFIAENAKIKGATYITDTAQIRGDAIVENCPCIKGDAYISKKCTNFSSYIHLEGKDITIMDNYFNLGSYSYSKFDFLNMGDKEITADIFDRTWWNKYGKVFKELIKL